MRSGEGEFRLVTAANAELVDLPVARQLVAAPHHAGTATPPDPVLAPHAPVAAPAALRRDCLGAQLRHACVRRLCRELTGDGRIHQFCIRSGDKAEFTFAKAHTDMHKFSFDGLKELTEKLAEEHTPVYLTVDLDCLDPALFCGTGTPEAGGVSFTELLNAILTVSKTNIVGADVNELAPMLDASGASTAAACKIVREMLLAIYK